MPKPKELNIAPSKIAGVCINIETGDNCKQPPIPNQDLATSHLLDQTQELTKTEIQTLVAKAIKTTNQQLQGYPTSGTTFTVCAVGYFNDENEKAELTAVCAHLGDSGALAVNDKGDITTLSRPHFVDSVCEQQRIAAAKLTNNIIGSETQQYLASGYNFFKQKRLPSLLGEHYLNSFIFIEKIPYKTSQLYYITATGTADLLVITNPVELRKVINSKGYEINLACVKQQPNHRFPDFIIHKILRCCKPYSFPYPLYTHEKTTENLDCKSTTIDVRIIANARALGNAIFQTKGMTAEPEFKHVTIQPTTTLILYTNGITQVLTLEQIAAMRRVSIQKIAFQKRTTDDHTTLIATQLNQLPKGKILFLIIADGDGVFGHDVVKQAEKFFIADISSRLAPKPVVATATAAANVDHKTDAKKHSLPRLNLASLTQKKPTTVPATAAGIANKAGFEQASADAPLLNRTRTDHKMK